MTTYIVEAKRGAAQDIVAASDWYEAQEAGLKTRFLDAVADTFQRIAAGPLHYPFASKDIRRLKVGRFPYSMYFRVRGNRVEVLALVHQNRDPAKLGSLLKRT